MYLGLCQTPEGVLNIVKVELRPVEQFLENPTLAHLKFATVTSISAHTQCLLKVTK